MPPGNRELASLISRAAAASPADRMDFRDAVAAHGTSVIEPMTSLLGDRTLGPFAVRVLTKVAQTAGSAKPVLAVLRSVDLHYVDPRVASDISDAIRELDPPRRIRGSNKEPPLPWPGNRDVTDVERRFHDAMLDIFKSAGEATRKQRPDGSTERGYWASYFLRGVRNHGGVEYARLLLHKEGTTEGFERLRREDRLDLTAESLVLRPEFSSLFTQEELGIASRRVGGTRQPRS